MNPDDEYYEEEQSKQPDQHIHLPPKPTVEEQVFGDEYEATLLKYLWSLKKEIKHPKTKEIMEYGIPDNFVANNMWGFLSEETVKTNKTKEQYYIDMAYYKEAEFAMLDCIKNFPKEVQPHLILQVPQTRILVANRGRRGIAGFERRTSITHVGENIASQTFKDENRQKQGGFLSRLLGTNRR